MTNEARAAVRSLEEALRAIVGTDPALEAVALGWATVDLDRTELAFRETLPGGSRLGREDLPDDVLLGARCRGIRTDLPNLPMVILVEPSTEGRLAASLARYGEGPAAAWVVAAGATEVTVVRGTPDLPSTLGAGGIGAPGLPGAVSPAARRSTAEPGPLGPEILLLDGAVAGPHRLLVLVRPGTITP